MSAALSLRPLSKSEIADLAPQVEHRYAEDIEKNGGFSAADARRKAAEDVPRLLRDRDATLFALEESGQRVGHLWIGTREHQGRRFLWVWDVFVAKEYRGRGLGHRAMQLAEHEARRRGLSRIDLNVFGGNEAARRLYRALGYEEVAVQMGKDLP
jgi:ribosomal protein S18 acetylase RimI-like enzyme